MSFFLPSDFFFFFLSLVLFALTSQCSLLPFGRMLHTNTKLASLEIDGNEFSLDGFKKIREGMLRNTTLKNLPIPVDNVIVLRSGVRGMATVGRKVGVPTQEVLGKVIKDIEARVSENYSKNKERPNGKKRSKKAETMGQEFSFKFIV